MKYILDVIAPYGSETGLSPDREERDLVLISEEGYNAACSGIDVMESFMGEDIAIRNIGLPVTVPTTRDFHMDDKLLHTTGVQGILTDVALRQGYTCGLVYHETGGHYVKYLSGHHPAGVELAVLNNGVDRGGVIFKNALLLGKLTRYVTVAPKFIKSNRRLMIPVLSNVTSFAGYLPLGSYEHAGLKAVGIIKRKPGVNMCRGSVRVLENSSFNADLITKPPCTDFLVNMPIYSLEETLKGCNMLTERKPVSHYLPVFTIMPEEAANLKLRIVQDMSTYNMLVSMCPEEYDRAAADHGSLFWWVYSEIRNLVGSEQFLESYRTTRAAVDDLLDCITEFSESDAAWYDKVVKLTGHPLYPGITGFIFRCYSYILASAMGQNM